MFYNTTRLTSAEDCATLLKQANFEKNDLMMRMRSLENQQDRSQDGGLDAETAIDFVKSQIESHEEHIPLLGLGADRSTAEVALLRLKMRLKTLERRAEDQSPTAVMTTGLELAQLDAQATTLDLFINAVTARLNELQGNTDLSRFN